MNEPDIAETYINTIQFYFWEHDKEYNNTTVAYVS